ncbi:hypothetical protein KL951_002525 [Ogataea haglerorum]|nr:hypothetical protein KL951_002525 [Ogataea haglerorum]
MHIKDVICNVYLVLASRSSLKSSLWRDEFNAATIAIGTLHFDLTKYLLKELSGSYTYLTLHAGERNCISRVSRNFTRALLLDTSMEMITGIPCWNGVFIPVHPTLVLQRSPYMIKQVPKNGLCLNTVRDHNFSAEVLFQ